MMSSATSTDVSFRPWHFFVLAALLAATGAVFIARGTTSPNIILLIIATGAAALAALAGYRMVWPLVATEWTESTELVAGRTRAALEREKMLVLRSIKELEFDRAMGKVSEADFQEMGGRLRARAVGLIAQLDQSVGYRELIERELEQRLQNFQAPGSGLQSSGATASAAPSKPDEAVTEPIVSNGVEPHAASRACVSCGRANDADARFCKECGTKLDK